MKEAQKKKKSKGFNFFIIILIGIMLFFSAKENQEKFISFIKDGETKGRALKVGGSIPMEDGIEDIGFYEKGIMVWKDKKLIRLKMDGTKEWEKEFNLDDPKIVFGENNIYVYEKPTGDIYFLNERGETVERIQLETKINNIVESYGFAEKYLNC